MADDKHQVLIKGIKANLKAMAYWKVIPLPKYQN